MLKLDEKFFVKTDSNQYMLVTLEDTINKDTGETYKTTKVHGYYATFKGALQGYVNTRLKEKMSSKKAQTVEEIKEFMRFVIKSLENIKEG